MGSIRYESTVKAEVEQLRKEGKTYSEIRKIYPIPKSTLSVWLGKKYAGVFDKSAQLEHMKRVRKLAVAKITKNKQERYATYEARAVLTAEKVPTQDKEIQKSLLAMLYWAEGKKGGGWCAYVCQY